MMLTAAMLSVLVGSGAASSIAANVRRLAHADAATFSALSVAIYVFILVLLQETFAFPIALYQGFLLDRRYGLSIEPARVWVRDHLKAMALGLVLSVAGAEVVYLSMRLAPDYWWLMSAAVFVGSMVLIAKLAPIVLLPLFYKFTPLDRDSLRARLVSLSERAGVPVLGVYEWALGEKTRRANAALVGAGATRRIIVSDTLLAEYSDDEIEVILAHEIGHHVHRDILVALVAEAVLLATAFCAVARVLDASWRHFGYYGPNDIAALPWLLLVGGVHHDGGDAPRARAVAMERAPGRSVRARPDRTGRSIHFGHEAAWHPEPRGRAPFEMALWLFHSHPPIEQRIKAARSFL